MCQTKIGWRTPVEGYLPDGSVVFEDGHVVDRNGNSWYPGNQGEQIACNGQSCDITSIGAGYYNNQGNGSQYNAEFYGNSRNDPRRDDRNNQGNSDRRRPPA